MKDVVIDGQLSFTDDGEIVAATQTTSEELEAVKVDYENLDKIDLVRLCKDKDNAIISYEAERKNNKERHDKELADMNDYYVKKIHEYKALIAYYDRKFKLIKNLIDIEKEDKKNDSVR